MNHKFTVPLELDFEKLRAQKEHLVSLRTPGINEEHLDGIIHLLDYIQDYAVDHAGIPETEVFSRAQERSDQ